MKVLLANKFFYPKGGDAIAFFSTADILKRNGHEVSFFSMLSPNNIDSPDSRYFVSHVNMEGGGLGNSIKTAGKILYSFEAKSKISELISKQHPDIAHLHNICHQISPSIIDVLKKHNIPVVMTMHDYKLTCAAYTLLANGRVCEDCSGGKYYKAYRNKCIKGSRLKSTVNVAEMYLHHKILHIYDKVDLFISPSRFLIEKTKEMGFSGKFTHLPNFVNANQFEPSYNDSNRTIVYFGRLIQEKGIMVLIDAVKDIDLQLKIIGDGPQRKELEEKVLREGMSNIEFLGYKTKNDLQSEIRNGLFTVLPSEWYENNPFSIIESFALGKPVIGAKIGGIPELIKEGENGLLFEPGDSINLRERIEFLLSDHSLCHKMGSNARKFVEEELNPEKHYQSLLNIYQSLVK
ncbi:MAG: glycosyltransferase family 4 protein [Candidatus Kuenenia sp.]|nr:glycosyltransferase family 4 protein [Candidatus Kuenenia hertensis]